MNHFFIKLFIILVLIALGGVSIFFLYREKSFLEEEVSLEIFSQDKITAGDELKYQVIYRNNSEVNLKNLELTFNYPSGSMAFDSETKIFKELSPETRKLDDLISGERGEAEFKAILFGKQEEEKVAKVTLKYSPEDSSAYFTTEKEFSTIISTLPLAINLNFPSKISAGRTFEFSLNYSNTSETSFPNLEVHFEYPQGFDFGGALPLSANGSVWEIGEIGAGESGEINIWGILKGEANESKVFKAMLGKVDKVSQEFNSYKEVRKEVILGLPSFGISQTIKNFSGNVVSPGKVLEWEIYYKNESDEVLEDLTVQMALEGKVFDYNSVNVDQGRFNSASNLIIWSSNTVQDLAFVDPQEEGRLNFSIKIKEKIIPENFDDKNFAVEARVSAKRGEVILGEARKQLKLATLLTFFQQGLFEGSPIKNSGPIPPKVGDVTTYTILWQVLNTTNDIQGLKIRGAIPQGVSWQNKVDPSDEKLTFDSNTGEIVWDIGALSAATGILMPVRTMAFQLALTPEENDVGKVLELIGPTYASGKDSFTGKSIEESSGTVDTTLPDDPSVSYSDGIVVE